MTTYSINYTSVEDCNCSCSHDTTGILCFDTLDAALNSNIDLNSSYEAHNHSVIKTATLVIESDEITKEYILATQKWNYNTQTWDAVETFEFDINSPDSEF